MHYVIDLLTNTYGRGHNKVEEAVKDYEKRIKDAKAAKKDYSYCIVEFVFSATHANGLPKYCEAAMQTKVTFADLPRKVRINQYEQLMMVCWNRRPGDHIDEREALALYERNWHHVDQAAMSEDEKAFLQRLVTMYGNGVLLV